MEERATVHGRRDFGEEVPSLLGTLLQGPCSAWRKLRISPQLPQRHWWGAHVARIPFSAPQMELFTTPGGASLPLLPRARLAGEVDALFAELMMTFSLPTFPQPSPNPRVFHGVARDIPPSPGKSECSCRRLWGSPCRGRDAVPCTGGSLRLHLPASLAPCVLCGAPATVNGKGESTNF